MTDKSEQRRRQRKPCLVPVDGKTGTVYEGVRTVDICGEGVGLISKQSLPVNEKILVQLDLEPDEDPVLVLGQVKWVSKMKDSDYFRVGMLFCEDLDAGSRSRLKSYFPE